MSIDNTTIEKWRLLTHTLHRLAREESIQDIREDLYQKMKELKNRSKEEQAEKE